MNQTTDIEDQLLAQGIKCGEKSAFQQLYKKYAPRIYGFARSYLPNESDAEELVQNVFIKVWEKRDTLDTRQNLRAYIFKIAVNSIYDLIRRKNIEHAYSDYVRSQDPGSEHTTWHAVIYAEMIEKLQTLIARLPLQQQTIFQLSKQEGLSNEEIATRLKLSRRTVENHLYRAIAFLKKHLKKDSLIAGLFFCLMYG